MRSAPNHARGFTIMEMAVVLAIVTLVLGSLLVPLTMQTEQRQYAQVEKTFDDVMDALMGYAAINGYLPCPDTDNDGVENRTGGVCTTIVSNFSYGTIPYSDIGLQSARWDPWGNRYRYQIFAAFASSSSPFTFSSIPSTATGIRVCATASTCTSNYYTRQGIVMLVSHGKNGYGATNANSNTTLTAPTSADELANTNNDRDFVWRPRTDVGTTAGEFDDALRWLNPWPVYNRMIQAGKLP